MDLLDEVPQPKKTTIESRLRLYFTQVATTGGNKDTVSVGWPTGTPNVAPTDLLVYYLPNPYTLKKKIGSSQPVNRLAGHNGLTLLGPPGTLTEVYMDRSDNADLFANITFHELMHNKLQLGNTGLHSKDGLAQGSPPPSRVITQNTPLTEGNKRDMAGALSRSNPQWLDGIAFLLGRKAARDGGDPTWNQELLPPPP